MVNFDQILKFQIYDLSYHFGLWTVNNKSEECVTLHNNFLEMSYELNIKIKCLASLLLGDVKNFLIPPRMYFIRTLYQPLILQYGIIDLVLTMVFSPVPILYCKWHVWCSLHNLVLRNVTNIFKSNYLHFNLTT